MDRIERHTVNRDNAKKSLASKRGTGGGSRRAVAKVKGTKLNDNVDVRQLGKHTPASVPAQRRTAKNLDNQNTFTSREKPSPGCRSSVFSPKGETTMTRISRDTLDLVAIIFDKPGEFKRAVYLIPKDSELSDIYWTSPDGRELHIPREAQSLFKERGFEFRTRELEAA